MKFKIKPYIYNTDRDLSLFLTEIHQMSLSEVQDGIDSMVLVSEGKYEEMSWGGEASNLKIRKDTSVVEYHFEQVAEFATKDIYEMLVAYRDALIDYEKRNVE